MKNSPGESFWITKSRYQGGTKNRFAKEVGDWLDENIPKGLGTIRDAQKMSYEEFKTRRAFAQKLGRKGWLYPTYPREYGGGGMDAYRSIVLNEELAKVLASDGYWEVVTLAGLLTT
jgi:alkylation response protein AidB-like acyl-CoA dehydrogenase